MDTSFESVPRYCRLPQAVLRAQLRSAGLAILATGATVSVQRLREHGVRGGTSQLIALARSWSPRVSFPQGPPQESTRPRASAGESGTPTPRPRRQADADSRSAPDQTPGPAVQSRRAEHLRPGSGPADRSSAITEATARHHAAWVALHVIAGIEVESPAYSAREREQVYIATEELKDWLRATIWRWEHGALDKRSKLVDNRVSPAHDGQFQSLTEEG